MNRTAILTTAAAVPALLLGILFAGVAGAMEPPAPGMLDKMKREGTYDAALARAKSLGNHKLRTPLRGAALQSDDPEQLAQQIAAHMGESLDAKGAKGVSAASQQELSWVQLDLNHDRVVDERDLLVLGYPRPKQAANFPSLGTVKTFCLLLDFNDYPSYFPKEEFEQNLFGTGTPDYYYRGLREYYKEASYDQLHIAGEVYGWHRATQPRTYYHPDDNVDYSTQSARQTELVQEAILAADAAGADFSQYDNDGDGAVDYFLCVWTGPHGDWSTFWWGYFGVSLPSSFVVDGVQFSSYSWQWEQYYGFGGTPPNPQHWDPLVTIHETGHALGLPDWYDYEPGNGPNGGLGGIDMMDSNRGDHGAFNKYYLGWLAPTIAYTNLNDQLLRASASFPDAVIAMPGYDPVTPWAEYFIVQNRFRTGLDSVYPGDGLLVWHVDSRLGNTGNFQWNNSDTAHKMLALVQADGLAEIENGDGNADAGDYYNSGETLSDASNPNSKRYDTSPTNITMNDISSPDAASMTADFTLYASNPPQVTINAPTGGDTITGSFTVDVSATDDTAVTKLQIFIDGELVASNTNSGTLTYTWNSAVDFNKPLNVMARAWDGEGQSGTAVAGVTVSNAGVTSFTDTFDAAPTPLINWRVQNYPSSERGQLTFWSTRTSPASPPRTGAGNEANVRIPVGGSNNTTYPCDDGLRAQRINSSGFTRPVQLQFQYRNRGGLSLWATTNEGATWQRLENLPVVNEWTQYNKLLSLTGPSIYLRFYYNGSVRNNTNSGQSGNIANFSVREAPSDPPTISFTSPADGATLSGDMTFSVNPQDDGSIDHVVYSILGAEVSTVTLAPWGYTRNTSNDDNDPALRVSAVAWDNDGLPSQPAEITVALRNAKMWPASDDFEAGLGDWQLINDGRRPEWGLASGLGRSGDCLGYFTATTWQNQNSDGALFLGEPPAAGRQSIDLSDTAAIAPVLSYWYKGQLANNNTLSLYFYSTWRDYQYITNHPIGASDWEQRSVSLAQFAGQSGRFVFWIFGSNSTTNGTAAYIDDVVIDNAPPQLTALLPNTGFPGDTVTLTGQNFGVSQGTVTFTGGTVDAGDYISWSNTSIQVRVPPSAQTGPVFVTAGTQDSNSQAFTISPLELSFTGLDPAKLYTWNDAPALTVTGSPVLQSVELWVDGAKLAESSAAPGFADLAVPIAKVTNGSHEAALVGRYQSSFVNSAPASFTAYSLRGDLNGDGVVNNGDAAALKPLLGLVRFGPGYEFWYDPDDDGIVTEADMSYIGYHWGETIAP